MRVSGQEPTRGPRQRIDQIDFWRGIVLCTIFINHIPGNIFEFMTQKNFGFSDSAEAFVFLSGMSLAIAYGPRFANGHAAKAAVSIAQRAVQLYGVHIALSLVAVGVFALGAFATEDDSLLEAHGRELFVEDPRAALIGLFSLGHQLGYFNILPLYVLLLAPAIVLLWIGSKRPWLMLAASFSLYVAARVGDWNMPTWPMKGTWFFDPFAWQFMMALGLCAALVLRRRRIVRPVWLVAAAVTVVALGLASVTDGMGLIPGLENWTGTWADLNKTVLGFGRIVHFAALAYLVTVLDVAGAFRGRPMFDLLCRLGRNSLWVFALLSVFAAIGQVLVETFGHSPTLDITMIGGGLAGLYGAATLLETRRPAVVVARAV